MIGDTLAATDEAAPDFHVIVVGGGAAGLAAAWNIRRAAPSLRLALLESDDRFGGTASTDELQGYVVDRGPNGVLTNAPYVVDWAKALGLGPDVVEAHANARRRYMFVGGRLRAMPPGLLHSSALGVRGTVRALSEAWRGAAGAVTHDESVYDFMARRFGHAAAELLAGPMVSGVSAGDAHATSMASLFPRLVKAEREHGSVIKGMRAAAGARPKLVSLRGGMGRLCTTAAEQLGDVVRSNVQVESVRSVGASSATSGRPRAWEVRWSSDGSGGRVGGVLRASQVVVATPSHVAARLMAPDDQAAYCGTNASGLAANLARIPYAGLRVVTLGFAREHVPRTLDGFGYLVPRSAGLHTLGCVWASNVFPDRAPAGKVALRVMLGGIAEPHMVTAPDAEALAVARAELRQVMGITAPPEFEHHARWPSSIPQYLRGHARLIGEIDEAVEARPGLHLCGNAYHGVSLNDTVRVAAEVAERVVRQSLV